MSSESNAIDSNITGGYIAEESSPCTLPGTPDWFQLDPNSWGDFGPSVTKEAAATINPSRQNQKGSVTTVGANGSLQQDLTQTNLTRLMQGYFYADAYEKEDTASFNSTAVPITSVTTGANERYNAASGLDSFLVGNLVFAKKFGDSGNNGLKTVSAVDATYVEVDETLTADASPASASSLEVCGFQFPSGDLDITASASNIQLETTATDLTTLGLQVGETIVIGGDSAAFKFVNSAVGYAVIKSIEANVMKLRETSFTPTTETGTGLTVQIFFGKYIKNQSSSLIVDRTYQVERQLGEDSNGVQSEYLEGAYPNQITFGLPESGKLTCDFDFVAMNYTTRDGSTGVKSGNRHSVPREDRITMSCDLVREKLSTVDATDLNNTALLTYIKETSIVINNNVTADQAHGSKYAYDVNKGNFEVTGSAQGIFETVDIMSTIINNTDLKYNCFLARENDGLAAAICFDIPLLTVSTNGNAVASGSKIQIPLEMAAAENDEGYTMSMSFLPYVPQAALPA